MDRDEILHQMVEEHAKRMAFDPDYDGKKTITGWFKSALTAIESAGYVLMPRDEIIKQMTMDEFSELMAGVRFKEPSDG